MKEHVKETLEIYKSLIKNKDFKTAEKMIKELDERTYGYEFKNYFLGMIYYDNSNPQKSDILAKRYFQYVIKGENPIAEAFIKLAFMESNVNHSRRILRKGLDIFPGNKKMYIYLLHRSEGIEKEKIINEIIEKKIDDIEIKWIMIIYYLEIGKFKESLDLLSEFDIFRDKDLYLLVDLIRGFCYLEKGELKTAKKIFKKLINNDIKHYLEFSQYFGLVICYIIQGEIDKAINVFHDINDMNINCWIVDYPFDFNFEKYFLSSLNYLENAKKNDKESLAKIKGLRGLYYFNVTVDDKKQINKAIKDLEFAYKYFPNKSIRDHLQWAYIDKKKYFEAFKCSIQTTDENDLELEEWDYILDADDLDFNKIINLFRQVIINTNIHIKFIIEILDKIIERLFKEKRYNDVVEFTNNLVFKDIITSEKLFEIAFSYSHIGKELKAKEFYMNYLNTNNQSSSALNNLGLIYQNEGDLEYAQDYFLKAKNINPDDEIINKNLNRNTELLNKKEREINKLRKATEELSENLNTYFLNDIGYNKELLTSLKKISSIDLQKMIERDIKENVLALLTKSYKTSLVISGSIIEAILLDKLITKKINKYSIEYGGGKTKEKKVIQMDLNELLFVAQKEQIISNQLFHFAHAIRDFRNLIHPGVEQRKSSCNITEGDAFIAWNILRKILLEI